MRIIVTTTLPNIQSEVDPRFGRSAYFLEVDSETLECHALLNPALNAWGNVGVQAAQFVADRKADLVISGNFGPNVCAALDAAGVAAYLFKPRGTAQEAIAQLKAGQLENVSVTKREERRPKAGV